MRKEKVDRKTYMKTLSASLVFLFLAALLVSPANAALSSAGPIDPSNGFPVYYQDASGLALLPCTAGTTNGLADPLCVMPVTNEIFGGAVTYNPNLPIVFPTNYPSEAFYWIADSKTLNAGPGGKARIVFRMALEEAFATLAPVGAPRSGEQITFLRINLKKTSGLEKNAIYTITYPFGTFQVKTDASGNTLLGLAGQAFRTEDSSFIPGDFASPLLLNAATTKIGPFLTAVNPPDANHTRDPRITQTITAGPNGNFLRIDGPNIGGSGINTLQTNQWAIAGKIMHPGVTMSVTPSANTVGLNTFADYDLTVTNTGNAPDKISLTIQGAPGAIAALSASSITLAAGAIGTVNLKVMSAELGSYTVGVTAASSVSPAINSVITTTTTVEGITPAIAALTPTNTQQFTAGIAVVDTWLESSGGSVGSIDINGLFTASAPGISTITATDANGVTIGTAVVMVGANGITQPLVAGYNMVLVPFVPVPTDPAFTPVFTASKLLQLVPAQNPGVTGLKVVKWDPLAQTFETYDPVVGLNDFPIEGMKAYFVKASANAANGITIVGPYN